MAAEYAVGMRYRFRLNEAIVEGTFDGYNDDLDGGKFCRWANVMIMTQLGDTPPGTSQRVPRADTHNTPIK